MIFRRGIKQLLWFWLRSEKLATLRVSKKGRDESSIYNVAREFLNQGKTPVGSFSRKLEKWSPQSGRALSLVELLPTSSMQHMELCTGGEHTLIGQW